MLTAGFDVPKPQACGTTDAGETVVRNVEKEDVNLLFKFTSFLRKEKLKNEIWFYVVCVSAANAGGTY